MEKKFKLDDRTKQEPFKAPDGYFESLAEKLDARIERRATGVDLNANRQMSITRTYLAIAASVSVIVVLSWFGYSRLQPTTESAETLLAQVSTEDLVAYISSDDMEIEEVVSFVDEDILNEAPGSLEDALHSLDDEAIDDLNNEFGISKDDTL